MRSAAAGEIVVESTISPGVASERESSPSHTSSTSAEPATIVNTMSRSARSAGESTIVAPELLEVGGLLAGAVVDADLVTRRQQSR